jgi:hypothetical protein
MHRDLFSVVLVFDPADIKVCREVRRFLVNFDRVPSNRIDEALNRGRMLIKRNVERQTAEKAQSRIRIEGAVCRIEKQVNGNNPPLEGTKPGAVNRNVPPGLMICPNCQTTQPPASECCRCGIIFAKIRKVDRRQKAAPKPKSKSQSEQSKPRTTVKPPKASNHLPSLFEKTVRSLATWHRAAVQWSQKPLNAAVNCLILLLSAFCLLAFLIHLLKFLWFIYTSTSVGEHFQDSFVDGAAAIEYLLGMDGFILSWWVVTWVLVVNLVLSVGVQLGHLSRLYLDTGSSVIRIVWLGLSSCCSAFVLFEKDPLLSYISALMLAVIPTALLLRGCLNLVTLVLPGLGTILKQLIGALRSKADVIAILKRLSQSLRNIIDKTT